MYIDGNGIAHVEDTDPVDPLNGLLNGLQSQTSATVEEIREDVEEAKFYVPRRVVRYRNSTVVVPNETWTTIGSWNQVVEAFGEPETDFTHGGTDYTCNFDGWVRVRAWVSFIVDPDGSRFIRLLKNGSRVASGGYGLNSASTVLPLVCEWQGPVSTGNTFQVQVFHNAGNGLTTYVSDYSTGFSIERIG